MKKILTHLDRRIVAAVLVLVSIELLFDPISILINIIHLNQLRSELSTAQALWKSHAINDYQIDIKGFVPLVCMLNARLEVIDGKLVNVTHYEAFTENYKTPNQALTSEHFRCAYENLTILEMFAVVEDDLNTINAFKSTLIIEFDPQFGFVNAYEYKSGYGIGISTNPAVSECCIWYQFEKFHPIDP